MKVGTGVFISRLVRARVLFLSNQNANDASTGAPSCRGPPGYLLEFPVREVGVWFFG